MSKHDTILKNLKALTGRTSIAAASRLFRPVERIAVPERSSLVSCELCGTRFGVGAWVTRPPTVKRISIGGTCLKTIVLGHFGDAKSAARGKRNVRQALERAYRGSIDPGAWITWIVTHAPRRFGKQVVELEVAGALRKRSDLQALIKFHDATRRFPAVSFFTSIKDVRRLVSVPDTLTIDQALAISRRLTSDDRIALVELIAQRVGRRRINELLRNSVSEVRDSWCRLSESGRATVVALAALHDGEPDAGKPFCPAALASRWPPAPHPLTEEVYLWHPAYGLAHVDPTTDDVNYKVWRLKHGYVHHRMSLMDWRDVNGASPAAIDALRRLAGVRLQDQAGAGSGELAGVLGW